MKMALKKHMMKMKMQTQKPENPMEEKLESPMEEKMEGDDGEADEKLLGDKAPALHDHKPMMDGNLKPEHIELLKELLAHVSHPGRDAMTMHEKSAPLLKGHMGSLMGQKKAI